MSGYDTIWKMDDRVIHLKDVIRYLNEKRRRVHRVSARSLYQTIGRRLETSRKRVMRADTSVPIVVVFDRQTSRPTVVLDGNHRLVKAAVLDLDIGIRIMYDDEYSSFFNI